MNLEEYFTNLPYTCMSCESVKDIYSSTLVKIQLIKIKEYPFEREDNSYLFEKCPDVREVLICNDCVAEKQPMWYEGIPHWSGWVGVWIIMLIFVPAVMWLYETSFMIALLSAFITYLFLSVLSLLIFVVDKRPPKKTPDDFVREFIFKGSKMIEQDGFLYLTEKNLDQLSSHTFKLVPKL